VERATSPSSFGNLPNEMEEIAVVAKTPTLSTLSPFRPAGSRTAQAGSLCYRTGTLI